MTNSNTYLTFFFTVQVQQTRLHKDNILRQSVTYGRDLLVQVYDLHRRSFRVLLPKSIGIRRRIH